MTATIPTTSIPAFSQAFVKATAIGRAALSDICGTMFDLEFVPSGDPAPLDATDKTFAGSVTVFHEGGSWEFALYGDQATALSLARAVLFMEPDEVPEDTEVLDVLGEMVNMVAGSAKTELAKDSGSEVNTTSPTFLLGKECAKHQPVAIPVEAQAYECESLDGKLYLTWSEIAPEFLVAEIAALIEQHTPNDKLGPSQMISHFQDIDQFLPESASDLLRDSIAGCEAVLAEVVNDGLEASTGIDAVSAVISAMQLVLDPSGPKLDAEEIPDPRYVLAPSEEGASALAPCERDEDTVEMLADFLQESTDGLEEVDGILLDCENAAVDDETVNRLFRIYHSMKGASSFLELTEITSLSHTTETLLAKVRDGKAQLAGQILDLIFDSTALTRTLFGNLQAAVENGTEIPGTDGLAELIRRLEAGIAGEFIEAAAPKAPPLDAPAPKQEAAKTKLKQTLKIDLELVEELEAAVEEMTKLTKDLGGEPGLQEAANHLASISAQIRMVSLASVFQKMTRMVRDLSKKTEKLTKVIVSGEDTKVPRHIVDGLNDPLVHIMRNAVDHGIEDQEERAASGKPMLASVRLNAYRDSGNVVVEISEDGRGMDAEKLKAKAVDKGLIDADCEMPESEAYMLIFAAGFSTAAQVTAISGRGVGMDVVRRNIEGMGGHIEVESNLGNGSTFRLVLPLVRESK